MATNHPDSLNADEVFEELWADAARKGFIAPLENIWDRFYVNRPDRIERLQNNIQSFFAMLTQQALTQSNNTEPKPLLLENNTPDTHTHSTPPRDVDVDSILSLVLSEEHGDE